MSKTVLPATADVVALMTRAGFTVANTEAAYAADAAADEFERRSYRKVLVGAAYARRYDPPLLDLLDLGRDLFSLTSVVYTPNGGAAETLVENTDYLQVGYSESSDAEPLTEAKWALEFLTRRWTFPLAVTNRRCVVVTGKWGMFDAAGTGMPDDLWQAILWRAGAMLMIEQGSAKSQGRLQASTAGVQTSWGNDPTGGQVDRWTGEFERAIKRYRRPGL